MAIWKKVLLIVLVLLLLVPWPLTIASDGGTYTVGNLLYQATRYHSLAGGNGEYLAGTSVSIFGIEVYSTGLRLVQE